MPQKDAFKKLLQACKAALVYCERVRFDFIDIEILQTREKLKVILNDAIDSAITPASEERYFPLLACSSCSKSTRHEFRERCRDRGTTKLIHICRECANERIYGCE